MAKESKISRKEKDAKALENIKEPTILIRPITRLGGLDNIHVALIALVIILIALLLVISYSKPYSIRNATNGTCSVTALNGSCASPIHNATQIKQLTEQLLASYAFANSSLSVLPYYANVSKINASYSPESKSWFVIIPSTNPVSNSAYDLEVEISDTNTNVIVPFFQIPRPSTITKNKVVTQGVIQIANKATCVTKSPLQIYWFADPYSPGSMASLTNLLNTQSIYGNKVNATLRVLFGSSTQTIANQVGESNAQALGMYIVCASSDRAFNHFVYAVNSSYTGGYVSPNTLLSIAQTTGVNTSNLNNCLNTVATTITNQALFANYYNISSTPAIVTDCQYLSIPQTENKAICYANSTLC